MVKPLDDDDEAIYADMTWVMFHDTIPLLAEHLMSENVSPAAKVAEIGVKLMQCIESIDPRQGETLVTLIIVAGRFIARAARGVPADRLRAALACLLVNLNFDESEPVPLSAMESPSEAIN